MANERACFDAGCRPTSHETWTCAVRYLARRRSNSEQLASKWSSRKVWNGNGALIHP